MDQHAKGKGTKTPRQKVEDFLKEQRELADRRLDLEEKAEERISYAKAKLMKLEPFFGMLLFKLPTMANYQVPTAATDGTWLIYNPIWIAETLLRKDVLVILMHEIAHIFWKHNVRGPVKAKMAERFLKKVFEKRREGKLDVFEENEAKRLKHMLEEWNFATDYVINEHIDNHMRIPVGKELKKSLLFDKKHADRDSESVYEDIKTPFDPDKVSLDDPMEMGVGGVLPQGFGQLSEDEVDAVTKEFEQDVQGAAMVAKRAGNLPAGVEDAIESLYKTTTPWQDVFRTIFTSVNKQDYTFAYPNRRYTQHQMEFGAIMPALYGEEYVDVGFIMDTSGSVGREEKKILTSELCSILEDYPIRLHVLYCDTEAYVDNIQVLTQDDIKNGKLRLDVKGGGGTSMRPAFDYYRDNQDDHDFQVIICMTDMYLFDWGKLGPQPEPNVYWARLPDSDTNVNPDWGTCIDIQLDGRR